MSRLKRLMAEPDIMIWDGTNTKEVTDWCCQWQTELCGITSVFRNQLIDRITLDIEPADVMRHSDLYIPLGAVLRRAAHGLYDRYIHVSNLNP